MSKCRYYLPSMGNETVVSECGHEVSDESQYGTFCTYCGKKIKETSKPLPEDVKRRLYVCEYGYTLDEYYELED